MCWLEIWNKEGFSWVLEDTNDFILFSDFGLYVNNQIIILCLGQIVQA